MNFNNFSWQIGGSTRWRAAQLYHRARKSFMQQQELLVEGFEELFAAVEKLQVAQEKLHQQNEELAAARKAAQVERQRYRHLLEFIPDACLMTDEKGIIQETNRAASILLNVPQQFLVSKPLAIFVSKEERRAFFAELTRLHFSRNQTQKWQVHLQPRNGDRINATLTVTPFHYQEDKLTTLGWLLCVVPGQERDSGGNVVP